MTTTTPKRQYTYDGSQAKITYPAVQQERGIRTGRPTLYDPSYCDTVDTMGSDGKATVHHIAARFNTTHQTINEWMIAYPEFGASVQRARERMAAYWLDTYLPVVHEDGKRLAQAAMIFHLKNITGWQDTRGVEYSGQVTIKTAAHRAFSKHIKTVGQDAIDAEYTVLDADSGKAK